MDDKEIGEILNELSDAYEAINEPYKARPFAIASQNVGKRVRGIGNSTLAETEFIRKHGYSRRLEKIKKMPKYKAYKKFLGILGVGHATAGLMVADGIRTLAGAKKSQYLPKIGHLGIKYYKDLNMRQPRELAEKLIRQLSSRILDKDEAILPLGSFRRKAETIGDLDILVYGAKITKIGEKLRKMPEFIAPIREGEKTLSCLMRLINGCAIRCDFFFCGQGLCPAYVQYGTGSASHNEYIRSVAKSKGYKLNQYGLFKGDKKMPLEIEKDIYDILEIIMLFTSPEYNLHTRCNSKSLAMYLTIFGAIFASNAFIKITDLDLPPMY